MKIYDCFTYFNEEEILKIRLNELNNYVDFFVIIEGNKTFIGEDKPFYLDNIGSWLKSFEHKIIKHKVHFPDNLDSPWDREWFQRNSIKDLISLFEDNDIIIISDVDEIVRPSVVRRLFKYTLPVLLDNYQYFWNFHWRAPDHCNNGGRPVAMSRNNLYDYLPNDLRCKKSGIQLQVIPEAGWHFSYFLNKDDIVKKIESFSHTEYNKQEFKLEKNILNRIENGVDPFDRFPLKHYEIDETYPEYIRNNFK